MRSRPGPLHCVFSMVNKHCVFCFGFSVLFCFFSMIFQQLVISSSHCSKSGKHLLRKNLVVFVCFAVLVLLLLLLVFLFVSFFFCHGFAVELLCLHNPSSPSYWEQDQPKPSFLIAISVSYTHLTLPTIA